MLRRQFLKNIAWLTGGFYLANCTPAKHLSADGKAVKGRVRSGGKGIGNVVVSDGYSVLQTDGKGRFELILHPEATSIFISTPSGYQFLADKSIARHYRLLQDLDLSKSLEFDLLPLKGNDNSHQFIIWADPQIANAKDIEKMMLQSVPDTKRFIENSGAGELIHGITVGDIVWDKLELFADYSKAVEAMGIPFFQCLGNHDMDFRKGGDETSDDTFQKTFGPTYYSFNRGQVHYVVMDNVRYLGRERDYDGYIQANQLDWLKKDLAYVSKDKLVVLCVHIPVDKHTKNNTELYSILEDRKVHIMSGHTHYNLNVVNGNIFEHNHGTVCGAWWTGPICGDGTPGGYGVYKVDGTELSWQYKSTGFELDHQLKIHVDEQSGEREVLANIWNYDPQWKNELWIDGVNMGTMTQVEQMDPQARELMLGPSLPKPRGFAEPVPTNHLFKAKLPAGAREIKVVATDRFKKVYSKTLQMNT